ncbi:MAG: tRNA-dihydrouridine synthase family protein [Spirochaetales bacterium]|nr:tRNA-dihydrouridine synthase family protein [Spirochaetales bacterium]
MAPLHGITNRIFRKAWFKHFAGLDAAMAPFILGVPTSSASDTHYKDLVPVRGATVPLVPQILGNDAAHFVETAKVLATMGYDEVNWNLGCPYPMVTKKKRGAGLLPFPDLVAAFLERVCSALTVSVSVKLRLGLRDRRELLALVPVLNQFPLRRVVIHPRVGTQMYGGTVDLDGFEEASGALAHEVVYNGDIRDVPTFESLQKRFSRIDTWMLGRGAVADPFLPGLIKGGALPQQPAMVIRAFHDELYIDYREALDGQRHVLDKMKELWGYLGQSFADADDDLKHVR